MVYERCCSLLLGMRELREKLIQKKSESTNRTMCGGRYGGGGGCDLVYQLVREFELAGGGGFFS